MIGLCIPIFQWGINPEEVSYEGIIAWEDGALMVPQQISGITVYLSYTRRHNDLTYSYDKDNITLPGADWQPGQQITYVLTLKPESLQSILTLFQSVSGFALYPAAAHRLSSI